MNTQLVRIALSVLVLFIALERGIAQNAGHYGLSSSTPTAGRTCAGGVGTAGRPRFALNCAVGQAEAGTRVASPYTLQGGFLPAFLKPTGPGLTLTRSYDAVIATWPANSGTGFHLEASASLNGPWVDFGEGRPTGPDRFVAVGLSAAHNFFRLRKACGGGCPEGCRE